MNKHKILCIDDEDNILKSLQRLLRKEPYDLLIAADGYEAIDLIKNHDIQMVMSDFRMPEMNGVELLQQVKDINPDAMRVILSGYADTPTILDAINNGEVYRFFTKPWSDDELKDKIREILMFYDLKKSIKNGYQEEIDYYKTQYRILSLEFEKLEYALFQEKNKNFTL